MQYIFTTLLLNMVRFCNLIVLFIVELSLLDDIKRVFKVSSIVVKDDCGNFSRYFGQKTPMKECLQNFANSLLLK